MPTEWNIRFAYGAWVAENPYGYTIWARTKRELTTLFNR